MTMKLKLKCGDSKTADRNIKYCILCEKCWEITIVNNFNKKQRKILYYNDFPNYGKEKQLCDICKKGENNGKNGIHSIPSRE